MAVHQLRRRSALARSLPGAAPRAGVRAAPGCSRRSCARGASNDRTLRTCADHPTRSRAGSRPAAALVRHRRPGRRGVSPAMPPSRDVDFGIHEAASLDDLVRQLTRQGRVELQERSDDTVHLLWNGIKVSVFVVPHLAAHVEGRHRGRHGHSCHEAACHPRPGPQAGFLRPLRHAAAAAAGHHGGPRGDSPRLPGADRRRADAARADLFRRRRPRIRAARRGAVGLERGQGLLSEAGGNPADAAEAPSGDSGAGRRHRTCLSDTPATCGTLRETAGRRPVWRIPDGKTVEGARHRRRRDEREAPAERAEGVVEVSFRPAADARQDGRGRQGARQGLEVRRRLDRLPGCGAQRAHRRRAVQPGKRLGRFQLRAGLPPPRESGQRRGDAGARELPRRHDALPRPRDGTRHRPHRQRPHRPDGARPFSRIGS
ncbi:MAG: hypothetical protein MZV64_04745 [Ignavibacteriales bacterium]|nr:hypothetical protein [Ignavibacteriales bacterium]